MTEQAIEFLRQFNKTVTTGDLHSCAWLCQHNLCAEDHETRLIAASLLYVLTDVEGYLGSFKEVSSDLGLRDGDESERQRVGQAVFEPFTVSMKSHADTGTPAGRAQLVGELLCAWNGFSREDLGQIASPGADSQ